MKIIAKQNRVTALVEITEAEWAMIQGFRGTYSDGYPKNFEVGKGINVSQEFDLIRQIRTNAIGEDSDAIKNSAEKIIKLCEKINEFKVQL